MLRAITILGLTLALIIIVPLVQLKQSRGPDPMTQIPGDLYGGETCAVSKWVTGVIVSGKRGRVVIKDDHGYERELVWGSGNPAVVEWDRRYTIGGHEFTTADTWWACGGADSVIPQ